MNFKVENIDNNFTNPKWLDKSRQDLNIIPKMFGLGFDVQMSYKDSNNNRTTPDNVPLDAVSFAKDKLHVWKCYEFNTGDCFWQSAMLIDGSYTQHVRCDDINDVIERVTKPIK